jgi:hypothetical protein
MACAVNAPSKVRAVTGILRLRRRELSANDPNAHHRPAGGPCVPAGWWWGFAGANKTLTEKGT